MYDPIENTISRLRSGYKQIVELKKKKAEVWNDLRDNNPSMKMDEVKRKTVHLSDLHREIEANKEQFKKDRDQFFSDYANKAPADVVQKLKNLEI